MLPISFQKQQRRHKFFLKVPFEKLVKVSALFDTEIVSKMSKGTEYLYHCVAASAIIQYS